MKNHSHDEYLRREDIVRCTDCGCLLDKIMAKSVTGQWPNHVQYYCWVCVPPYNRIETHAFTPYSSSGMTPLAEPRYFKEVEVDKEGQCIHAERQSGEKSDVLEIMR